MGVRRYFVIVVWRVDKVFLKRIMVVFGFVSFSEAVSIEVGDLGGFDTDRCWFIFGVGFWREYFGW